MPRLPLSTLGLAAAFWLAAAGVVIATPVNAVPRWIAALATLIWSGYAILLAVGRVAPPAGERRVVAMLLGTPLALALAATSGALGSPAVVVVALLVLANGWGNPRRAAALAPLALLGLAAIGARGPGVLADAGTLVIGATILASVGVLPAWLSARGTAAVGAAQRRVEGYAHFFGLRLTPDAGSAVIPGSAARAEGMPRVHDIERRRRTALGAELEDLRELHGAERAILWRPTRAGETLVASTWTGGGDAPQLQERWLPLVQWAASERMPASEPPDGAPLLVAVPVIGEGDVLVGVLSVHAPRGFKSPPERLKAWIPRHAAQVGRTAQLLDEVQEYAVDNLRSQTLLGASQSFQRLRDREQLGEAICGTALQVTSGARAFLVHWFDAETGGTVENVIGEDAPPKRTVVTADSLVGEQCLGGSPLLWENAQLSLAERRVFGPGEPPRRVGSLGVYPLKNRGDRVHGALVIEGLEPYSVLHRDMRNVGLLTSYASLALETVWEIAEVTHRSRTDQLTGLYNRRYFDEKLVQVKAEYERQRHPCSLIIADVDFFKKFNDAHGHDAGDAVLRAVAATFRENVRTVDTCARFGGEEIAVLMPNTPLHGAVDTAERLRAALEARMIRFAAKELRVTASFGVATYPDGARNWEALFTSADRALYEAKRDGRNCVKAAGAKPAVMGS